MPFSDKIHLDLHQGVQASTGKWYRHIEILGSGGNAITALVVSTSEPNRGGLFALKIFKKLFNSRRRERFLNEADFLKECSHPNIMRIFDTGNYQYTWNGKDFDYPFVVAEYLPKTLADVIRENSSTLSEKVSYILQVLSALVYLHERSPAVIHRDIKPANIFVKGGACVLGDFGLMKIVGLDAKGDPTAFKESLGGVIPWAYRTPDLVDYANKGKALTPASDIFQLGLVATELFTGRNPCKKPRFMTAPVEMHAVGYVPGTMGRGIALLLERMLDYSACNRPSASGLMNSWEHIFWDAIKRSHELEGHAFKRKG